MFFAKIVQIVKNFQIVQKHFKITNKLRLG